MKRGLKGYGYLRACEHRDVTTYSPMKRGLKVFNYINVGLTPDSLQPIPR